ncbi:MAG: recombination mediator RecR [Spirochaetaceae bacterium]|jgi:recombination protein RecR|nr:recombination mediator RecR [Spirochaetaceae bacterium]
MSGSINAIDRLVVLLSKLPGIGKKSATRMAYYILDADPGYSNMLAEQLSSLHQTIRRCSRCGSFAESDPCPICADPGRDTALICVVERPQDIRVIEESREFRGYFHVLGGLIAPLEGIGPNDLTIGKLLARIKGGGIKEIILALNPTVEGDTTSLYIQKLLKGLDVELTRLASGLPVGGDLEYADRLTLSRSFRGRVRL